MTADRVNTSLFHALPQIGAYRTIVADPPWEYPEGFATRSRTPGKWQGPVTRYDLPYPSMSIEDICEMPVHGLGAKDCRLFLWTTNRWIEDAFTVMRAWRFKYRQTLTWKKLDGLSGSLAPNSEFLIVGTRGAPGRLSRLPNAVIEHSQTKEHSKKPELFLDLVEQLSPSPYLEMFSRRARIGWDVWGNESLSGGEAVTKSEVAA